MMFLFVNLIIFFDLMIMVLLSVAFLTLLERKILGYIQLRKGPNKVSIIGLIQPFSDAIKLFSKENFLILKSNYYFYLISPIFSMILMLLLWQNMPIISNYLSKEMIMLMIFLLMSMSVFPLMVGGWSSNSIYSLIGGLRSVAQTVSYEVSMMLIMLFLIFLTMSFNLYEYYKFQSVLWFFFMMFPLMIIFYISLLAEMNRTPFDLAEGESELVSGFNIEYMSGSFALIFIAEYGMIMFMMFLFSLFYFGGGFFTLNFYLIYLFNLFSVIWIRGTLPRIRYDKLMELTWMKFLPVSLLLLIFSLSILLLNY